MILHPGIIALLIGSSLALLMVVYAGGLGLKILARWDFQSSSAQQLQLERRTYLISTIVNYALGFEIISGLLLVYTLDDIHRLFVGAMCATGSLNANPIGWYLLLVKIVIFFATSIWVVLNRLDQRSENYPLVKLKYRALLLLAPLLLTGLVLQLSYFLGLQPEIITSCCGALFSLGGSGVASELAGIEPQPAIWIFYCAAAVLLLQLLSCLRFTSGWLRYLLSLTGAVFFFVAVVALISFISLYIYEMPTHHCPFDMLQANYSYIGYPLYICMFAGVLFSLLPGLFRPLGRREGLGAVLAKAEKSWLRLAILFLCGFVSIVSWKLLFGSFKLLGY